MRTKWMKCIIAVAILLIVAVCILPRKMHIDTTIDAVEWVLNKEDSTKKVSVKVKGTYNTYLFKKNSFDGEIQIDGYSQTDNATLQTVYFTDGVGNLIYQDKQDSLKMTSVGFLVCSSDFKEVLMGVYSDSGLWTGDDGIVISGSASDYVGALQTAKKLSESSEWLSRNNPFDDEKKEN